MFESNYNREAKKELANYFKASFPYLYITSYEERRVEQLIKELANDLSLIKKTRKVHVWSYTSDIKVDNKIIPLNPENKVLGVLEYIQNVDESGIFILKDFHPYLGAKGTSINYQIVRKMRDLIPILLEQGKTIVLLSPVLALPQDLEKDVSVFEFKLPTLEDLETKINEIIEENSGRVKIELSQNEKQELCKSALGLTLQETENVVFKCMVENGSFSKSDIKKIQDEKSQIIKKSGFLEFIKTNINIHDVGGLENIKNWLIKRKGTWLEEAKNYALDDPKGVLITGVPGCGKSLVAKAIGEVWNLPVLRLDAGKLYDKYVGGSEENMRRAISTAEAVSPCVLWIDEIEKGFGSGDGSTGSEVSSRVFGTFLTWMQEKEKAVFVVATANKISGLPPEFLRKGRFDEIFFVDLPTINERKSIFELHLLKRLTNPTVSHQIVENSKIKNGIVERLAKETEGFTGSEIEALILNSLQNAFYERRELRETDLLQSIKNTVPLSVTQSEQISILRKWAVDRAISATITTDRIEYEDGMDSEIESKNVAEVRGGRKIDF